jgi:hypothetical protein
MNNNNIFGSNIKGTGLPVMPENKCPSAERIVQYKDIIYTNGSETEGYHIPLIIGTTVWIPKQEF